jgi:hypothetical protein
MADRREVLLSSRESVAAQHFSQSRNADALPTFEKSGLGFRNLRPRRRETGARRAARSRLELGGSLKEENAVKLD